MNMIISGTPFESVLASMLTNRSNVQIQAQITLAVLKNQQEQQAVQAAALVRMINDTSLDGTGKIINRAA